MKTQAVAETLGQAAKIRPALAPILQAFEPLFTARRAAAEKLAPKLAGRLTANRAAPLLEPAIAQGLGSAIREAALTVLPPLLAQETAARYRAEFEALFLDPDKDRERELVLSAMLADDEQKLAGAGAGIPPEILYFGASFIIGAVLRALAADPGVSQFTNGEGGHCPVCGKPPVIAWLGKRPIAEPGEFLASGGGKKYLHCDFCGTDWHILRGVCPACGTQGEDAMQIYGEEDRRHERIDWCRKCRSYLPCIDLREIAGIPDMDAMALALLHLDMVAAEKELIPLKPSFWNMF